MPNRIVRAFAVFLGACIVASLLIVATEGVSGAGEDTTLCRASGERVAIPDDFVIDACFDGKDLVLRNRKEIVLRVSRSGSAQRGALTPVGGVPTVAAGLIKAAHSSSDPDLLPPNYELRIPVSGAAGSIELFGVKTYQHQYVLTKGLITAFGLEGPLLGAAQSFVDLNQSLISTWSNFQNCAKAARGYFGRVGCDANYTRDVAIALGSFAASLVGKVQINKAKFSVDGIRNILDTADWVNVAVGDFSAFLKGQRKLSIAAAGPNPAPPGSDQVGPAPVLSQTSGPAGRLVSFTVDNCPAVPPGKRQALDVSVEDEDGNQFAGGVISSFIETGPDGSVSKRDRGWPYFRIHAKGQGSSSDPRPGEYQVKIRCVVATADKGFDPESDETVKKFEPSLFRVTGPSPTVQMSATSARVGDVIRVAPTAGCPTGTVAPEPYASIYMVRQTNEALPLLSRGSLMVQRDGSWIQEFRVQKGAVPGRYMAVAHCSHMNAQTPGQNYGVTDTYLTILPEQAAGSAAAARTAQPSTAASSTVPSRALGTTPEAAGSRSIPRVAPMNSPGQTRTSSATTTTRPDPPAATGR